MIRPVTDHGSGLENLLEEFAGRLEAGEAVDVSAFAEAHPEHAEQLRRVLPTMLVLADLGRSASAGGAAPPSTGSDSEAAPGMLGDFRTIREVGRGGMGIVYEAEQLSLGRRVALKVLPFAATMDPRQLQRFHNEARAAAGLHHTNIVPVYGVGNERGVHYYAMQFIEGRTLADSIAQERHGSPSQVATLAEGGAAATTEPPAAKVTSAAHRDTAYFRRVAEWGIQAAEALDCAHALGVVHRDIKPGNLLLDGTGRLWVTDFGLAQVQNDARLTMTGDLVGTLRYMSPEQALAKRVVIDHRTDVYSLGATLYELLTLQPPYPGNDRQELLRQIAFEDARAPRRVNKGIPAELEVIVLKAMEKNPADHYATAQALADDLRRYLMHEPIRARRSSLLQRARKKVLRHPGVAVTAAIAVFVGLLLGVAGLAVNNWMVRREQVKTQNALDRAEQAKAVSQAVRHFLRNKLLLQADPRAQAEAARKGGGKSADSKPNPTIRELLDRAAAELTPDKIEEQFPGQLLVQAEILKTTGEAYGGVGDYGKAIAHLERARELHTRELGPDHADTLATTESLGRTFLDDGKATEAAGVFEQVRDIRTEKLGPDHPDTLASMNDLSRAYFRLKRHDEALKLREDIVRRRTATLGHDHPDTLTSMFNLANSYAMLKRMAEARDLHEKTVALRKATLGANHPDTCLSMNNLANCYAGLDQPAEALKLHKEALELRRATLGADHTDTLQSMNNVAMTYYTLGQHADALKLYEETLELRTAKLRPDHRDRVQSINALAWLLANSPDRTLRNPDRALELAKEAVKLAPEEGRYWNTLGTADYRVGDWKGAVGALRKSMELRKGGDGTDLFFLALAHWQLGDKDGGRAWYGRAVQWMEKHQPGDEDLRQVHAEAAALLGIEMK
jgi:serine/threonine protein kinase